MQTPTQPPQMPQSQPNTVISPLRTWLSKHWKSIGGIVVGVPTIAATIQPIMGLNQELTQKYFTHIAKGEFSAPTDNSAVPSKVTFEGKVNAPKSGSLWLFIYASGIGKYYPYEIDPNFEAGTWKHRDTEIGVESDYQKPFKAELVLIGEKESRQFRQKVNQKARQTEKGRLKERGIEYKPDSKTLATVDIVRAPR